MKPTYKDLHEAADVFWQKAWWKPQIAIRRDVSGEVRELQEAAYELQLLAANEAQNLKIDEPELSIVTGTAANMALEIGRKVEAAILAGYVLAGAPPPEIHRDMLALLAKIPEHLKSAISQGIDYLNAKQN